jgi:hypothetical protein
MLGTRSKRNIEELSLGLPDDFREIAPKKSRYVNFRVRDDGSRVNHFVNHQVSKKSTVYMPDDLLSPKTSSRAQDKFKKVKGHRSRCKFTTPTPISGRHRSAITPGGTELSERIDLGSLVIYFEADKENLVPQDTRKKVASVLQSKSHAFKCVVTPEDLIQVGLQKRTSQARVKGLAAKQAVQASNIEMPANQKWHWLHMIAFFMKGKDSQKSSNLFAGTDSANYRHLNIELEVPYLLKHFPNGLTIFGNVIADANDVAKSFTYNIATDDFILKFQIDAQSLAKPNIAEGEFVHSFVKAVIERNEEKKVVTRLQF